MAVLGFITAAPRKRPMDWATSIVSMVAKKLAKNAPTVRLQPCTSAIGRNPAQHTMPRHCKLEGASTAIHHTILDSLSSVHVSMPFTSPSHGHTPQEI